MAGLFRDKNVYPTKAEVKQAAKDTVTETKKAWREVKNSKK